MKATRLPPRGGVFYRELEKSLPKAVRADGVWIEASDGKRYIDASGGAVVVNIGHSREEVARAVYEQLKTLSYVHPTMFTSQSVEDLSQALGEHAPGNLDRFYFLTSGSEAVEASIKLALQIQVAKGRLGRTLLISRWKSYHGLTMGALAASGRSYFREPYYSSIRDAIHIHAPYCYRCSYGLNYPDCDLRCATALDETIQNLGPGSVSAFIAETVGGASLASCPPPPGYWGRVREICNRHNVLLILDEVMCGLGRTGRWFAAEHYDVVPDLMTMGKGLSGGTLPLSAVAVNSEYVELIRKRCGNFAHGGTFSHHSVTCAAGLATIRILEEGGLVERAESMGEVIGGTLRRYLADSPHVGDIRGIGMMWGIEIVEDRKTMRPFPRRQKVAEKIWDRLFSEGIITYKSVGLAGTDGDALMVAPPFTITEEDVVKVAGILRHVIDEELGS